MKPDFDGTSLVFALARAVSFWCVVIVVGAGILALTAILMKSRVAERYDKNFGGLVVGKH
jgi:hypothetical protein